MPNPAKSPFPLDKLQIVFVSDGEPCGKTFELFRALFGDEMADAGFPPLLDVRVSDGDNNVVTNVTGYSEDIRERAENGKFTGTGKGIAYALDLLGGFGPRPNDPAAIPPREYRPALIYLLPEVTSGLKQLELAVALQYFSECLPGARLMFLGSPEAKESTASWFCALWDVCLFEFHRLEALARAFLFRPVIPVPTLTVVPVFEGGGGAVLLTAGGVPADGPEDMPGDTSDDLEN